MSDEEIRDGRKTWLRVRPGECWSAASGLIFVALFIVWLNLYGALEPVPGGVLWITRTQ